MRSLIICLSDEEKHYYMFWNTACDAPSSRGMPLEDFKIL